MLWVARACHVTMLPHIPVSDQGVSCFRIWPWFPFAFCGFPLNQPQKGFPQQTTHRYWISSRFVKPFVELQRLDFAQVLLPARGSLIFAFPSSVQRQTHAKPVAKPSKLLGNPRATCGQPLEERKAQLGLRRGSSRPGPPPDRRGRGLVVFVAEDPPYTALFMNKETTANSCQHVNNQQPCKETSSL